MHRLTKLILDEYKYDLLNYQKLEGIIREGAKINQIELSDGNIGKMAEVLELLPPKPKLDTSTSQIPSISGISENESDTIKQ